MNEVFKKVVRYCHNNLLNNKNILSYLINERRIKLKTINRFKLGLFPNDLRLLFDFADPKDLRCCGIIRNASTSVFKTQNLIIPIVNAYGKYIALAGRVLINEKERKEKAIPKYINSVYKKSQNLFGLNLAKFSILKNNVVYVVEGYFDVIMAYQNGLKNVVATCGSFLSSRHIVLLSRYTDKIIIILDNEEIAQEKARMIVEKKKFSGVEIFSKNPLENDNDIDDFLKNHSVNELLKNIDCC